MALVAVAPSASDGQRAILLRPLAPPQHVVRLGHGEEPGPERRPEGLLWAVRACDRGRLADARPLAVSVLARSTPSRPLPRVSRIAHLLQDHGGSRTRRPRGRGVEEGVPLRVESHEDRIAANGHDHGDAPLRGDANRLGCRIGRGGGSGSGSRADAVPPEGVRSRKLARVELLEILPIGDEEIRFDLERQILVASFPELHRDAHVVFLEGRWGQSQRRELLEERVGVVQLFVPSGPRVGDLFFVTALPRVLLLLLGLRSQNVRRSCRTPTGGSGRSCCGRGRSRGRRRRQLRTRRAPAHFPPRSFFSLGNEK